MIKKLSVSLLTIAAMVAAASLVSQAHPQTLLTHHVRAVTQNGQAPSAGRLPATQTIHIDIVLPLRDRAGLESFLQDLYTPSSAFYRHFLTPQEFIARFGASQVDYDAVVNFAKANGFTVVGGTHEGSDVQLKGFRCVAQPDLDHGTWAVLHGADQVLDDPVSGKLKAGGQRSRLPFDGQPGAGRREAAQELGQPCQAWLRPRGHSGGHSGGHCRGGSRLP